MRSVIGGLLLVAILAVAGVAALAASEWERRLAEADRRVATLAFRPALADYDSLEASFAPAVRMPWIGERIQAVLHGRRVTAYYWLGQYADVAPRRAENGEAIDRDPTLMLLTANATYRGAVGTRTDRQSAIRGLDGVVNAYAEVLRNHPGHVDAAFNLEYVAKLRARWAALRTLPPAARGAAEDASAQGQLPSGETIHGMPGGPPPAADTRQFQMVVPNAPEERQQAPGDGSGRDMLRKG